MIKTKIFGLRIFLMFTYLNKALKLQFFLFIISKKVKKIRRWINVFGINITVNIYCLRNRVYPFKKSVC